MKRKQFSHTDRRFQDSKKTDKRGEKVFGGRVKGVVLSNGGAME
jgi:hypothetical protein